MQSHHYQQHYQHQHHNHVHTTAPHLSHADPWAQDFICCDLDHAASSSSANTSSHTTPMILPVSTSGSSSNMATSSLSSALPSGTITPATTNEPCPMEMYCCTDEYCTEHHIDCCADPQCDQPAVLPCSDVHCTPTEGQSHDHEASMADLEAWACTKEGCHAIQQYLECCHQVNCDIQMHTGDAPTTTTNLHTHSHVHNHNHQSQTPQESNPFSIDNQWPANFTPSSTVHSPVTLMAPPNTLNIPTHVCHWQNCHRVFASMPDLLGHVAADHLGAPGFTSDSTPLPLLPAAPVPTDISATFTVPQPQTQSMPDPLATALTGHHNPFGDDAGQELLSCLWDDCLPLPECTAPEPDVCPTHAHMPAHPNSAHSHNNATGEPFSPQTMLRHVLEEHLGVPTSILSWDNNDATPPIPANLGRTDSQAHQHHHVHHHGLPTPSTTHHTPSPPPPKTLVCLWPDCTHLEPFADPGALMAHLSDDHVGKGKDAYTCQWDGCDRTFRSRQKVLRHLQSHTGHRPFVCPVCEQAFGEAAPLAAHMRRHAQEKPFKCDHPGCGKSFAISSSLTIHMRTHNGEKPFICPHCQKGFVEASNLTKHIRTHTGERPFACAFPGCGKRFPRPDQLKRHMSVHDTTIVKGRRGAKPKSAGIV